MPSVNFKTEAQKVMWVNENPLRDILDVEEYKALNDAVESDAKCGVKFSRHELDILSKLLRGYVVGPDARKVLDKVHGK